MLKFALVSRGKASTNFNVINNIVPESPTHTQVTKMLKLRA